MLMIGNSPKGFPLRSKIIHSPERDDLRRMPCGKDRSQIKEYKGLIAGGEKSSASIIRATCTFETKKVIEYRFVILVIRFGKVS